MTINSWGSPSLATIPSGVVALTVTSCGAATPVVMVTITLTDGERNLRIMVTQL